MSDIPVVEDWDETGLTTGEKKQNLNKQTYI